MGWRGGSKSGLGRDNAGELDGLVFPAINDVVGLEAELGAGARSMERGDVEGGDVGDAVGGAWADADDAEVGAGFKAGAEDGVVAGVVDAGEGDFEAAGDVGDREAGDGQSGEAGVWGRQVKLGSAQIGQGVVNFDKEEPAGKWAALSETGLGVSGLGKGGPSVPLRLGERLPTGVDGAPNVTCIDLSGGAWVKWDEGRVADLAVGPALPDPVSEFA